MSVIDRVRKIWAPTVAKIAPIAYPEIPAPVYEKAAFEPQIVPQIVSKWARAFLKPEYLRGQIAEAPLMARAREVRRKVLDTFPTLKYILEGQ